MRRSGPMAVILALAGCPQAGDDKACGDAVEVLAWADADGDGFGGESLGAVCALGADQVANPDDCDDSDPAVNPTAEEVCDQVDNNCNAHIDEDLPETPWYADADGDGYGSLAAEQLACTAPGPEFVAVAGDCDDSNAEVSPDAVEVCNEGVDDDCNGVADDDDLDVDPTTYTSWHPDQDSDTFGNAYIVIETCVQPVGLFVSDGSDCDDERPLVNPLGLEVCNNLDDDCDGLLDDADDSIDQSTQQQLYADLDGDGYGDAASIIWACEADPYGGASQNDLDCNDADPDENVDQQWSTDSDGDGVGDGVLLGVSCLRPTPDAAPHANGVDCDDDDPDRFPGNPEDCLDNIDQDCDGSVTCCDPAYEVDFNGVCYYLDGSGGLCDLGYELAPQSVLAAIAGDFVGLTYKNQVSGNCCIWHADQAAEMQDWGMDSLDCNQVGPFDQPPLLGGAGCINSLNLNIDQLTFCKSL